jgi:hypothetical protein
MDSMLPDRMLPKETVLFMCIGSLEGEKSRIKEFLQGVQAFSMAVLIA